MNLKDILAWTGVGIALCIPLGMTLWSMLSLSKKMDEESERYWSERRKKRGDRNERTQQE